MTVIGKRRQRVGWWATLRAGITDTPTIGGLQAGTAARIFADPVVTSRGTRCRVCRGQPTGGPAFSDSVTTAQPEPSPTPSTFCSADDGNVGRAVHVPGSERFPRVPPSDGRGRPRWIWLRNHAGCWGRVWDFPARIVRGVAVIAVGSPWIHACSVGPLGSDA